MKQIMNLLFAASVLYSCTSSTAEHDASKSKTADATFDVSKVRQSIEAANKKFADAVLKGDSATVVSLYHTDAEVYPPNMPANKRTLMGTMAATIPKSDIKTFTLHTVDVTGNEEQVVETGTFEMGNGSKTVEKGKYIVVWKPENGDWKLWRDIWNSDNATTPPSK